MLACREGEAAEDARVGSSGPASQIRPQRGVPSVMKVLLLGSRGQLGRAIIRANHRLAAPFELLTPDRQQLDLSQTDEIQPALKDMEFDVLVNCTGFNDVDKAETNSKLALAVNSSAVEELAQACAARKARLIHFSTDYVFGGIASQRRPITENSRASPINIYGHSKLLGELSAPLYIRDFVVMRVATLFGSRWHVPHGNEFRGDRPAEGGRGQRVSGCR